MQRAAAGPPGRPLVAQKPVRVRGCGVGEAGSQSPLPGDSRRALVGSSRAWRPVIRLLRGQSLVKWGGAGLPPSPADELRRAWGAVECGIIVSLGNISYVEAAEPRGVGTETRRGMSVYTPAESFLAYSYRA